MNKKPLFWAIAGLVGLILFEAARVYFIMPFPGSQLDDAANLDRVAVAYWLHRHTTLLRILAVLAVAYPVFLVVMKPARLGYRWLVAALLLAYAGVVYLVNTELMADHMFQQPVTKRLVPLSQNKIPANKLVLGVVEGTEARAYPLQLIGYHHQVRDTVGGKPIMVTYCTVCRTGRVFDPVIGGKPETFRLVGMDHFNAMFEDASTGSWWRQATGEAIVGSRKGQTLNELPARQMTLVEWSTEHPNTLVMQPDPAFKAETDSMACYDLGVGRGKLTRRDSVSWKPKSWVLGVVAGQAAKAFDWNELVKKRVINGQVGTEPVLLAMAPDQLSFGTWSRTVQQKTLTFSPGADGQFTDHETNSFWSRQGIAVSGSLSGQRLTPVRGYQEFWHSWQSFHPGINH